MKTRSNLELEAAHRTFVRQHALAWYRANVARANEDRPAYWAEANDYADWYTEHVPASDQPHSLMFWECYRRDHPMPAGG